MNNNFQNMLFEIYKEELINSAYIIGIILIVRFLINLTIKKIGRKSGINKVRIRLICRYVTVTLIILTVIIEAFVFGAEFKELAVVFSSVFAVIGIALFAIWSILSNVTSGIILFFSFPYKAGDKIRIHDKDFPLEGIIEDIRAFQLHLRINNGDLVTYPNNLILQKAVTLVQKDAFEIESDSKKNTDLA